MTKNEQITSIIIKSLEAGKIPWRKPWTGINPQNYITRKPYRGINHFLLSTSNFEQPYFLTYNQARQLGGGIKKGCTPFVAIFWTMLEYEKTAVNGELKADSFPFMKTYLIYNIADTYGIEYEPVIAQALKDNPKLPTAESILDLYTNHPTIEHNPQSAYYRPATDTVSLPTIQQFNSSNEYYSTLFHELTHSTGAKTRLDRHSVAGFGSVEYAKEELTAELGAAFLCSHFGIDNTLENSAAYIQSWLKALKNDPSMVISASAKAQKAFDYMTNSTLDTVTNA